MLGLGVVMVYYELSCGYVVDIDWLSALVSWVLQQYQLSRNNLFRISRIWFYNMVSLYHLR